jgi:putative sugar O-methyltransferase
MMAQVDGTPARQRLNKLNTGPVIAERLLAFMSSEQFAIRSGTAKSDYWKYHSGQLQARVTGNGVEVGGESGFYVPQHRSLPRRAGRKLLRALREPSKAAEWLKRGVASAFAVPRLMSYPKAFDSVMSHAEVAMPILSPFLLNHRELARLPGAFASAAAVNRHYKAWSGYEASANIYNHYYYQNILLRFADRGRLRTVLEIGPGNGNFPSILYHDWSPIRVVLIDLPETLAVSIPYLSSLFPRARILMPHEVQTRDLLGEFDFAFLTVDQLHLLPDSSVDLAINCHSFQEMTQDQIGAYFTLIQRASRESGLFFTANRVEKIPCGPDAYSVEQSAPPNRMAEYPWNPDNETLVHEISRLSRLVQLDPISIRLERIRKGGGIACRELTQ